MRLPWVARAHFDLLRHNYDEARHLHASMCVLYEGATSRFDNLLEKYHALKLQGATITEPQVQREKKEIDELTQAVLNKCAGKSPQIRAMMLKQLNDDRNNPLLEEIDILRRIENGFTADDVGLPE